VVQLHTGVLNTRSKGGLEGCKGGHFGLFEGEQGEDLCSWNSRIRFEEL
jgi:hypothetical protein